ncbi:hypothetical protein DTO166G4_2997 [Paecilomyces variotii]|nr:hypothetical protein DTO166G4_2997 [Paecilomyces variotii]KAJ9235004.1 hypothetical protein DTO166G5_4825 [Paecilomyces variotii]KAJ9260749.1 hypothetical protein DTO195F2_4362 [Paecilomyces variotii]KAJ9367179.1 hypothetical protein DTO282E5_8148 [Paecilomyces variotii]
MTCRARTRNGCMFGFPAGRGRYRVEEAQALVWCNGRASVLAIARIAHSGWWDARGGRDGKHHPLRILSQFGKGSLGPWRKRISRWPTIAATVSISPVRAPGRPVIIIIVAFRLHRPSSGSLSYALAAEGTVLLVVLTAARKRPDLTASSPASTCLAPLLPAPTPWLLTSSIPSSSLHPPSCPERHCQLDGLTWDIASSTPPQRLRIFIQVPLWVPVVSLSHHPPVALPRNTDDCDQLHFFVSGEITIRRLSHRSHRFVLDIILKLRCRIPSPSVTRIIVSQQPITQLSDVQFLLGNSM